jgi:hypothetical protein
MSGCTCNSEPEIASAMSTAESQLSTSSSRPWNTSVGTVTARRSSRRSGARRSAAHCRENPSGA